MVFKSSTTMSGYRAALRHIPLLRGLVGILTCVFSLLDSVVPHQKEVLHQLRPLHIHQSLPHHTRLHFPHHSLTPRPHPPGISSISWKIILKNKECNNEYTQNMEAMRKLEYRATSNNIMFNFKVIHFDNT